MSAVRVHKNRTNVIPVSLGIDVSLDTITSQIRSQPQSYAPLIAEWVVTFATDGTDGELILTMDNTIAEQISAAGGFMDIKRVTGGEPVPVFDQPLEVIFVGTVTL